MEAFSPTYIAHSLLEALEKEEAIFPILVFYSNEKFKCLVEELFNLEAVDAENMKEYSTYSGGYIEETHYPNTLGTTSVYILSKENEEEYRLEELRKKYDYVAVLSGSAFKIMKGTPTSFIPVPPHAIQRMFRYLPDRDVFYGVTNKSGSTFIGKHLAEGSFEKELEHKNNALSVLNFIAGNSFTYKFTVVRNPYSRLVSCYKDIINGEAEIPPARNIFFRRSLGLPTTGVVTFDRFISQLERRGLIWTPEAEHWITQVQCNSYPYIRYDDIGKCENLLNFLRMKVEPILRSRGDKRDIIFPSSRERESGASKVWKDYYNTALKTRVYRLYEIDFDTFGYTKEI